MTGFRHYYWKKFFMGKHPFLRRMRGLQLHNEGISRLGRRISAFVESGCYHYQQTLLSKLGSSKMSNHTKDKLAKMSRPSLFEPLNLSKSISTVFIIICCMLLLTIIVHGLSLLYFYKEKLINICSTVGPGCVTCLTIVKRIMVNRTMCRIGVSLCKMYSKLYNLLRGE